MEDVIVRIRTIISYIPLLWRDRDMDYTYLDNLILFKLKRMKNRFDKGKENKYWSFGKEQSEENQKSYKALCICIEILERESNYFYFDTYRYLIDNDLKWEKIDEDYVKLSDDWTISSNLELFSYKQSLAEKCMERDEMLFKELFSKYKKCWWV